MEATSTAGNVLEVVRQLFFCALCRVFFLEEDVYKPHMRKHRRHMAKRGVAVDYLK